MVYSDDLWLYDPKIATVELMLNQNGFAPIIILLGILILAIFGGVGYYFYSKTSVTPVQITQTHKLTSDVTNNWITFSYANEFNFKYPANWSVDNPKATEGNWISFFKTGDSQIYTNNHKLGNEQVRLLIYSPEPFNDFVNNLQPKPLVFLVGGRQAFKDASNAVNILLGPSDSRILHIEFLNEGKNYMDKILATFNFSNPPLPSSRPQASSTSIKLWEMTSDSNIELLVTNSTKQQSGYLLANGRSILDIPNTQYELGGGITDPSGQNPPMPAKNLFYFENPPNGIYQLQIIGKQSGKYRVTFYFVSGNKPNANLKNDVNDVIEVTTSVNQIDSYSITLPEGKIQKISN